MYEQENSNIIHWPIRIYFLWFFAWHNETIFLGHVDDTNIVITNTERIIKVGRIIAKFEGTTGAIYNIMKTKVLLLLKAILTQ